MWNCHVIPPTRIVVMSKPSRVICICVNVKIKMSSAKNSSQALKIEKIKIIPVTTDKLAKVTIDRAPKVSRRLYESTGEHELLVFSFRETLAYFSCTPKSIKKHTYPILGYS